MSQYSYFVAGEIRAEMARQRKTISELGEIIGKSRTMAHQRYTGAQEFSINETELVAKWLGVPSDQFYRLVNSDLVTESTSVTKEASKAVDR